LADAFVGMIISDHELAQFTLLGLVFCLHGSREDVSLLQVSTLKCKHRENEVLTLK